MNLAFRVKCIISKLIFLSKGVIVHPKYQLDQMINCLQQHKVCDNIKMIFCSFQTNYHLKIPPKLNMCCFPSDKYFSRIFFSQKLLFKVVSKSRFLMLKSLWFYWEEGWPIKQKMPGVNMLEFEF